MDLSKVLGDVYADDVSSRPTAPEWADEAHLDEAFAGWTPGPPPEAPAAEHEMAAHDEHGSHHRIDDDLAAALTQALSADTVYPEPVFADHEDVEDEPEPLVAYEPAPVDFEPEPEAEPPSVPVGWSRGDDDVLPSGKGGKGRKGKGLFSRLSR